ncbi:MAG: hypothetical protein ACE5KV_07335 [Thermoplasmata archaeon]
MYTATEENMVSRVVSSLYANALEPTTYVIGCGGAGCNIVSAIHENCTEGVRTIAMNVDQEALNRTQAEIKICLERKTEPKPGTLDFYDNYSWMCDAATLEAMETVESGILFLVSGMGGKTGTALAPAIAKAAKEKGIVTIAIAISPFSEEGRSGEAEAGIKELGKFAQCVINLENDSLKKVGMNLPFNQAVGVITAMVTKIVESVKDWISRSFLATIAEEVDAAAKEMLGQLNISGVPIGIAPPLGTAERQIDPVAVESNGRLFRR